MIKKQRKAFKKGSLEKGTKMFLKKKKAKSANMLVSKYIIVSEEKKEKKYQYWQERCKTFLEDEKQMLVE